MIGLIRMHFIISISSSDKHGYFELHDNVINMLPVGMCIRPECHNRRNKKHKEQQRKTQRSPYNTQF